MPPKTGANAASKSYRRPRLSDQDWWSWDLFLGAMVGVAVGVAQACPPLRVVGNPKLTDIYVGCLGVCVGLLGAILAVMAIFTAFMARAYRRLLMQLPGGLARPLATYRIAAVVAAAGSLSALMASLFGDRGPIWFQAAVLGVTCGLVVWLVIGVCQLLVVTVNHVTDSTLWEEYVEEKSVELSQHAEGPMTERPHTDAGQGTDAASGALKNHDT